MATRLSRPKQRPRSGPPRDAGAEGPRRGEGAPFPIVGVGASAGGLEAFRQLLAHVPADAGLALVLVQHLEATRTSLLSEALVQGTGMKVSQAVQGTRVEPNHVYVIPPGALLAIERGALQVTPLDQQERRPHLPIDHFLRSLAAERGRSAIGVVLSGTAADGTAGLGEIRAQGGITFAQEPQSARFGEMPQHAVDAGVIDFCLPLPALGAELTRLARHPYLARGEAVPPALVGGAPLAQVLALVRSATGVDFREHKPATLQRRLARRMAVRRSSDLEAYLAALRQEPAEVGALFDDLLIKVTSFFRDDESFDDLRRVALPDILRHKPPGAPIRAWVVGCATGEEVYSLAISILEQLGDGPPAHPVLIFGSDLSERSIETARAGIYGEAAVRGLGAERLRRFFVQTERGWRVSPAVRELCVFMRHDVARDPPFAKLDLVSCRNVLIYFGAELQRRVLSVAHYALNQPGYLLLGRAESASGVPRWFVPASQGSALFARRPGASTFRFAPRAGAFPFSGPPGGQERSLLPRADGALARHVDELVLARYGPPGVVVNERLEVVQYRGRTGRYLEAPQGEPQAALLKLARPGLAAPLRVALAQARRTSSSVRRERIMVEGLEQGQACDLMVIPVPPPEGGERTFLVLFEERPADPAPASGKGKDKGRKARLDGARRALEEELASTREHLALVLEEHGRGHQALASANDELVSGNEELQSLNEELETAKEEVQASNEELTTLNDELHDRNLELQRVNADVLNLLDAVELPILMLDEERRLRRFTRRAASFLGLAPGDTGRRLTDLSLPIQAPDLELWIARAMSEATLVEAEVHDREDRWHRLQVRPSRAPDGRVDGTILSLADIDELRHEVTLARWARDYAHRIVEAVQVPLLVLNAKRHVLSANAAYYRLFQAQPLETEGRDFFELAAGAWKAPGLQQAVLGMVDVAGRFQGVEVERALPGAALLTLSVSGCQVPVPAGEPLILLALEDVTERRQLERHRAELLALSQEALHRAERADAAKDLFMGHLSHELRTPLTAIQLQAELLQLGRLDAEGVRRAAVTIQASTRRQVSLVEDLLDATRIVAGTLRVDRAQVDLPALVLEIVEQARLAAEAKGVRLTGTASGPVLCDGDPVRLQQVVTNLVTNAVKFTPRGGRVEVSVDAINGQARLVVADTGRGITPAFLPRVFDRFSQEGSTGPHHPGLGLGLAIVQDLVRLHGGAVTAESPGPDLGATFTVTLPRSPGPAAAP